MKAFFTILLVCVIGCSNPVKAQNSAPDSLYRIGLEWYSQAKYDQAIEAYEASEKAYLAKGDSLGWSKVFLERAGTLIDKGKIDESLELLLPFKEVKGVINTDHFKAELNYYIGYVYRIKEDYESSKKYYSEALNQAAQTTDSNLVARLHNNISYAYLYSGDYVEAYANQLKAKEMYEALGYTRSLSAVLNGLFLTLSNYYGLHAQAQKYIRESLRIRKQIGNPNLLDIAYHNMASSFRELGQLDSAIIYYQKSLEISRKLQNPYDITQTLINIGSNYERSGDAENALLYYNEALDYNRQTGRPASIAKNLSKISGVAESQGDFTTAESFLKEAIDLLSKSTYPRPLVNAYYDFAHLKFAQHKTQEARDYILKGLNIATSKRFSNERIRGLWLYGSLLERTGEPYASLQKYREAYRLSDNEGPEDRIRSIIRLARAYEIVGSDSAFILADRAFSKIDSQRTNVSGLTFRAGYFRSFAGFYNEAASWYILKKKNAEKAFELVEAAKARVLMDDLAESEQKFYQKLDESTLIKKQQLQKQVDKAFNQLSKARSTAEKEDLKNEFKDLKFKYETFLNEIRQMIPEWKVFDYPESLSAKEVMNMLDDETALLEYALTENRLMRFYLTDSELSASVTDSVEGRSVINFLNEETRRFREEISIGKKAIDSEVLFDVLMPVKELEESNATQMVMVPEGPLSYLPFEALRKQGKYVIEKYNIKYLPSASIFPHVKDPHRKVKYNLLAIAGSGFDEAGQDGDKNRFASLPSAILEVDSIAANFENPRILKNEEVSEAALKSFDLSNFRFLHFATHADIDEVNPAQSGLLLSQKTEVESLFGEDGHLNSNEISGLQLNADLVTLSACNTAMGKMITGEGILGLQRSFLSAGASSVVVSLWSIYDRSSAVFMSNFYRKMIAYEQDEYGMWNQTLDWFGLYTNPIFDYKARALRDAKLDMIDHPYYNAPVYWAPFILIGK